MKAHISEFNIEQELNNNGMQLDIYSPNGEDRLGELTITKIKLIWCAGKLHKKNGIEVTWTDFITWMGSEQHAERTEGQRRLANPISNAVKVILIATKEGPEDLSPAKPNENEAAAEMGRKRPPRGLQL